MTKYQHTRTAFIKALNELLTKQLFRLQDAKELNNLEKCHLPGLSSCMDWQTDLMTEMQMTEMKPKDVIKLEKVPLVVSYPQKTHCLRMDCIITCCRLEKNTTTSEREPRIEYGV